MHETVKRQQIDPVFKEVLNFRFGQLGIGLQTQVEVSRIPRTIDAMIVLDNEEDLRQVQSQTPFFHFRQHNSVEFKGIRDPLTAAGFGLILGRGYLYAGQNEIQFQQMTITIVCARKPRSLLSRVRFQPLGRGYYVREDLLEVHLIVINELPIVPPNYPLLLFASSLRKFRQFLTQLLESGENLGYIRFAYHLQPQLTKEVLTMAGRYRIPRKNLEFMAKDIGPELVEFLSPEERLRGLSSEERLRGLDVNELDQLTVEERRILGQLLDKLNNHNGSD